MREFQLSAVTQVRPVLGLAAATLAVATAAVVLGAAGTASPAVLVLLSVVAALLAVQMPATVIMARRMHRLHAARGRMLSRVAATAQLEHRRLARELREEVLQDLAGVGYSLDAAGGGFADGPDLPRRLAEVVQRDIRTLRRVLGDVQPPDLSPASLAAAIGDLTTVLRLAGVVCVVRVPEVVRVPDHVGQLLYQTAREALRNVDRHAGAGRIEVAVMVADTATLTVTDDGVGFAPGRQPADGEAGGLGLLRAAVTDAGGTLAVGQRTGAGTSVAVTLPLRPPSGD